MPYLLWSMVYLEGASGDTRLSCKISWKEPSMRMCMPHWNALKAAISLRGLDSLVAKDGKEVVKRMISDKFEPLMFAHNMIIMRCIDEIGLHLLTPKDDSSDYCPLCAIKHDPEKCCEPNCTWIEGASDAVLIEAQKRGLIKKPLS